MDKETKKVVEYLFAEGKRIKVECPMEVKRLYKYHIVPSRQCGPWDQAFTTMVFAEGDLRSMNAYMLWMIVRLSDHKQFTAVQLKAIFRDTVPLSAEFLGTCGFESIWENCKKVLEVLDNVDTKEDFKELVEGFASYITNYHNWVHFYFPWYIGDLYKRRNEEDVKEMAQIMGLK